MDLVDSSHIRRVSNPVIRRVTTTEDFTLPQRSEAIVQGKVQGKNTNGDILVGPLRSITEVKAAVAHSVVKGTVHQCPVRLLNPTEDPVTFKKGDIIAGAEEVEEVKAEKEQKVSVDEFPEHLREMFERAIEDGQLNEAVAARLEKLLRKHAEVFATSDMDLGRIEVVQHDINTGDAKPIRQPPRRLPMSQQAECEKEIQNMLEKGVIEAGQSSWASPVVLVRKKDGTLMFCVDYRRLNGVTCFDAYPLPRIDETLEALGGASWFTTIDLLSGYWQVRLTPEARMKSAFCVRSGLYLWNVMPFGALQCALYF